jgi:predicted CoA-substrate-specific enzyme activase
MPFAGIDVGSLTAQAVLIEDGRTPMLKSIGVRLLSHSIRVKPNPLDSARTVMGELLEENGLEWGDITSCVSTGYGRDKVQGEGLAQSNMSEISCHGTGAHALALQVRTIIDIGGQDAKVIRVDASGDLVNFVMNDKCASGSGRFLEVMSHAVGVDIDDIDEAARGADHAVSISSQCGVFAESEVITHVNAGEEPADIVAGLCDAVASIVSAQARKFSQGDQYTLTGGVARIEAVAGRISDRMSGTYHEFPHDPRLAACIGAALLAGLDDLV